MDRASSWKPITISALLLLAAWQLSMIGSSTSPVELSPPLAIGDELPGVLTRPLGSSIPVELLGEVLSDECYYVYGFDPACPACAVNAGAWSGFALPFGSTNIPVIWMSLSDEDSTIAAYVADHDIRLPVRLPLAGRG